MNVVEYSCGCIASVQSIHTCGGHAGAICGRGGGWPNRFVPKLKNFLRFHTRRLLAEARAWTPTKAD